MWFITLTHPPPRPSVGDVPHAAIGGARRMQVASPHLQHRVMIEAVENHMPEVIIIDEIGTPEEAAAARTIAQRGVQLIATAHGNYLENVIKNPSLADLIGGVGSVTLSDDEARRRGVQKSVLEREGPPTFDVAVEMTSRTRWRAHLDVGLAVDVMLMGKAPELEVREALGDGAVRLTYMRIDEDVDHSPHVGVAEPARVGGGRGPPDPRPSHSRGEGRWGGGGGGGEKGWGGKGPGGRNPTTTTTTPTTWYTTSTPRAMARSPTSPSWSATDKWTAMSDPYFSERDPRFEGAPGGSTTTRAVTSSTPTSTSSTTTTTTTTAAAASSYDRNPDRSTRTTSRPIAPEATFLVYLHDIDREEWAQVVDALGYTGQVGITQVLTRADAALAVRARIKGGGWLKKAAQAAGVPVYAIKNANATSLVRAVRTLVGEEPSPAGGSFYDKRPSTAQAEAEAETEARAESGKSFRTERNVEIATATATTTDQDGIGRPADGDEGGEKTSWEEGEEEEGKWEKVYVRIYQQVIGKPRGFVRPPRDVLEALGEVREAVEEVVVPLGQPMELMPRETRVLEMQTELVRGVFGLRCEWVGQPGRERLRLWSCGEGGGGGGEHVPDPESGYGRHNRVPPMNRRRNTRVKVKDR